jgi:pilus assembly protein Flp/PilA
MYIYVMNGIHRLLARDDGVTAIEYGLIAGLITVVIIGSLSLVGQEVDATFNTWTNAVHNAVQSAQAS